MLFRSQENKMNAQIPSGEEQEQPENRYLKKEMTEFLAEGIKNLKENEQLVISLYYMEELNMRQIAKVLDVSEPRISQIHTNAIRKLKQHMQEFNEVNGRKKNVSGIL